MNRAHAWVIAERTDGEDTVYDVLHGRVAAATGLSSPGAARLIVGRHRKKGERVWSEDEADGYRTELTKSFPDPTTGAEKRPQQTEEAFDPERPARSRYLARYGRSSRPGKWV